MVPARSNRMQRELVVPWSMDRMYFPTIIKPHAPLYSKPLSSKQLAQKALSLAHDVVAFQPGGVDLLQHHLEENSGFAAEYSSVSGRFSSDFTGAGEKGRLLYGSGGPKLTLATTWGDIRLQRAAGPQARLG